LGTATLVNSSLSFSVRPDASPPPRGGPGAGFYPWLRGKQKQDGRHRNESLVPKSSSTNRDILREVKIMVKFLRTPQYNNSQAVRRLTPKWVKWAWAIRDEDVKGFLEDYDDVEWEEVDVNGKYVYAIDFQKADQYVTGVSDEIPELEPFDPEKHCLQKTFITEFDEFGLTSEYRYWQNPYAVIISPIPLPPDALHDKWVRESDESDLTWLRGVFDEYA